jgi:hypothetical protein
MGREKEKKGGIRRGEKEGRGKGKGKGRGEIDVGRQEGSTDREKS